MLSFESIWAPNDLGIPQLPTAETDYRGDFNDSNLLGGDGDYKWQANKWAQEYHGQFYNDCMHGFGIYQWRYPLTKPTYYDGQMYANALQGYGTLMFPDGNLFEGLFKGNRRFGPGIYTYADGTQDVGLWDAHQLVRLSGLIKPEFVPQLGKSPTGKIKMLQYKKLIPVNDNSCDIAKMILSELGVDDDTMSRSSLLYATHVRNPKSLLFDNVAFDQAFFGDREEYTIEVTIPDEQLSVTSSPISPTNYRSRSLSQSYGSFTSRSTKSSIMRTKKISVTHLIAWNNMDIFVEMLKHAFLHRNSENLLANKIGRLLAGDRVSFRKPGVHESNCISFLVNACVGNEGVLSMLVYQHDVNPNVCDANGNASIIYAASKDNLKVICELAKLGVDFNHINDEGLTALQLCLLRYSAIKYSVSNWEAAFLQPLQSESCSNTVTNAWNARTSRDSLSKYELNEIMEINNKQNKILNANESNANLDNYLKSSTSMLRMRQGKISSGRMLTSQSMENYNAFCTTSDIQNYIFKIEPTVPVKQTKQKDKVKEKPRKPSKKSKEKLPTLSIVSTDLGPCLRTIYATILLLLENGASPHVSSVPNPSIILGTFTESPEVVKALLKHNADPNVRMSKEDGCLTPLHIIASLTPSLRLEIIATLLLNFGADPDLLTSANHWPQMKETINNPLFDNELTGKTALHMLALRPDMELDAESYLTKVVQILLKNNADPNILYLGHTPLSIAVVKGNKHLVTDLLETEKVDPHQRLGSEYGNALTVLLHNNYLDAISLEQAVLMLNTLVDLGANPLYFIDDTYNAVEFVQNAAAEIKSTSTIVGKKSKKDNKQDAARNKEKNKNKQKLLYHLFELNKKILTKNFEGNVLKTVYNTINVPEKQDIFDGMFDNTENITFEKAVQIFKLLGAANEKLEANRVENTLEHILEIEFLMLEKNRPDKANKKQGRVTTPAESEGPELSFSQYNLTTLATYLCTPSDATADNGGFHIVYPETDTNLVPYDICFECQKRLNVRLIACPQCGLVKFCSSECNRINIRANGPHKCPEFYDDVLNQRASSPKKGKNVATTKAKKSPREKSSPASSLYKSILWIEHEFQIMSNNLCTNSLDRIQSSLS